MAQGFRQHHGGIENIVKKLCYIATISAAVHAFLRSHIQAVSKKYQVTVIRNSMDKRLLGK